MFDTTWTQLFPETQAITNITYQYIYFNIPIKAQYYILTRKAKLFLTAGLSPNIFLVQKTTLIFEYSDGHTETNTSTGSSELTTINLTAIAGFGFSYDLTSKLFLKIEPIYRQSLTSIINAPIKEYLYSVGLNTGFYYRL
ncbi:MAG: outer membrane beta-barrel protein [Bacteroidales bacterium]|nr:outer membrane beta-barrel protein [Bacteroidales bacterium]